MDRLYVETKFDAQDGGEITALAWPFETPDRVGDVITKGAFKSAQVPLPMLFGHDQNDPIGAWSASDERDDGLYLKGRLLVEDVTRAREVRALVLAGAVTGISIGFITKKSDRRQGGGRLITEVELLEASIVTLPCHPGARVTSAKTAVRVLALASQINRAAAHLSKRKT
jgi:HK97 family phage prohead protease